MLGQLRARGVGISIDDVGAGYTSLALLRALPVTALKIERSLVAGMLENPSDRVIAEAVIDLGHRLGLPVVAEAVETGAVPDELIAMGCDIAQGFGISPALPADALERLFASPGSAFPSPGPGLVTAPSD